MSEPDALDLKDELEVLQNKIADQLSELSSAETLPTGFKPRGAPFLAGDVEFTSPVWLARVLQVQAWLWLGEEVSLSLAQKSPIEAASRLFAQLDEPAGVSEVDGSLLLTAAGAEALCDRLDIAMRLQVLFVENLESFSRKEATKLWLDAWEEEVSAGTVLSEQIKAKSGTWCLSEFSYYASRAGLNLNPSYQRGDVWPTSDSQKLIESILRGIPLPSIILLTPAESKRKRFEVVDGKQRLTSILRFVGAHPEALKRVSEAEQKYPNSGLLQLFQTDYRKFRRAWKKLVGESLSDKTESSYYFPFALKGSSKALAGSLKPLAGKYYTEIKALELDVADQTETVEVLFERTSQYKVPIIEYTEATPRQIQEVFNLYNKQGKHLNAEEMRNALFHEVDLIRLMLIAAGDNRNYRELAKYLPQDAFPKLEEISALLTDYRFGTARYKRTKVLSWLMALLFLPSTTTQGALIVRSTAKQIDGLLAAIQEVPNHSLSKDDILTTLVSDLQKTLIAHSTADCWAPTFKDDETGAKWLELHLVASLAGVFLLSLCAEDIESVLLRYRDALLKYTASVRRPENAQNNTQWGFIGEVALGILDCTAADLPEIQRAMVARYGITCLPTLVAARAHYPKAEELT